MVPTKQGTPKREYKRTVRIQDNPASLDYNDDLPLRDTDGKLERDRCMDFYVLLPKEIEAGGALPYVLSFRRTSLKAGKKLATQMFVRNRAAGVVPAATACVLSAQSVQNDDGEFVVQDVAPSRQASAAELAAAFEWLKIVKTSNVKVDESEFKEKTVSEEALKDLPF